MGLKTIEAMRAELRKQADALAKFKDAAKTYVEAHAKISAAYENLEKTRKDNLGKVQGLETYGIKEFDDYKKNLVSVYSGWSERPLPLKPLEEVVAKQQKAVDDAVAERVAKLAASFPKDVKPGMVFRFEPSKALWEIVSGPEAATNKNLSGDAAKWFKYKSEKGTGSVSLAELKKSCKFIKT